VTEGTIEPQPHVLQLIARRLPYLNPALRRVGEFILERPEIAKTMTITQLAVACDVAESTVSRFVREVGLERYQALRLGVAEAVLLSRDGEGEGAPGPERGYVYEGITRNDSSVAIIDKIARSSHGVLRRTAANLDATAIEQAVDLVDAAGLLIFVCQGSSSVAADNATMRFTRAGKKCLLFHDQSLQVMTATIATPGDVVIGISESGETTPVVEALERARANGAATIAITSTEGSPITRHATVTLFTSGSITGDTGLYGESMTSKWGQILVMDVLYAAFAVRHVDETLRHLEDTYTTAIRTSRRVPG
jgi:RpiR family transcriptional regulator, carbohydrate utilization regulator